MAGRVALAHHAGHTRWGQAMNTTGYAALLLLAAAPASAQISFDRGSIDIQGTGSTSAALGSGLQTGSIGFSDYSACDGQEEYCLTLPYGGRYANGGFAISITGNSLSYRFDLWQGSDIGGPLANDYLLEAFFISDTPVRLRSAGRTSISLANGCGGCSHVFDIGSASANLRPDGRWDIGFTAFMQGNANAGGQRLVQEGRLKIAAVPEPASWALLIAGFGLVGTVQRRRRYCAV
ncbi:hypothetical protein CAP39_11505 [Sphingomonas sp. IBVSS1]|nr:hypothetical protein CAP39_11505 [Sphingomonas sp. IBVSS1]